MVNTAPEMSPLIPSMLGQSPKLAATEKCFLGGQNDDKSQTGGRSFSHG